ncbi:MAG: ATP-binding cassette domain-containing protein [Candidatus Margulisbacteria bacterium]|jgi:ABC-2 type transport system ATP-binding protein|nr:ATP-binding cassette domain-containing protein [Candidatus Margulisiibacteriota bacterium]
MSETIVRTINLSKAYSSGGVAHYAVQNLNVEIGRGQIYGFIGQNGAGKTTLIRMLTGLIQPTEGRLELFGKSGDDALQKMRRKIGCIVETPALYPNLTARENLEVQARLLGLSDEKAIKQALRLAGIADTGTKKACDFSLGMRQRLALAQAMLAKPELLILDEPVNGLDPKGIIENRELLKRLAFEQNMTILISSHILSELALLATHYGIIDRGRLIKQIGAEELQKECRQCIRLCTPKPKKTFAFLKERFQINELQIISDQEIHIFERLDETMSINMALCKADIPVTSIICAGQDLEGYFMKLTQTEFAEGVAA